jgi:hypothetical protein
MPKLSEATMEELLGVVNDGYVDKAGQRHDGLVRALCWGKRDAWDGMAALVEAVCKLNEENERMRIELEQMRNEIDYLKDFVDA